MNLLQLEYFQEVAKAQSITKAAKKLKISQSALSIMMNKLESSIGYPLLNRQGRTIRITRYGEVVLYYSYILLNEMKDIQQEFIELQGLEQKYTLVLGVTDNNYYGDWLLKLMEQYPDMHLNVLQMSREDIYRNLLIGNLDFGISNQIEYHDQLSSQLLFSQPYQLLVRYNHPLASKGTITVEELM